jgi:hypothetical protein
LRFLPTTFALTELISQKTQIQADLYRCVKSSTTSAAIREEHSVGENQSYLKVVRKTSEAEITNKRLFAAIFYGESTIFLRTITAISS